MGTGAHAGLTAVDQALSNSTAEHYLHFLTQFHKDVENQGEQKPEEE